MNHIGDKRVVNVFVSRGPKGRFKVKSTLVSDWDEASRVQKLRVHDTKKKRKMIDNKKKLIKHFEHVLDISFDEEEFINNFFLDYIQKGTIEFKKKLIVWDEEEVVTFDSLSVIEKKVHGFTIPESIVKFAQMADKSNYIGLITAYYQNSLLLIKASHQNTFISGMLHTDLALATLVTIAYFPGKAEPLAKHLLDFLIDTEERFKIYPENLEFGYSSTLYLTSCLLDQLGHPDISSQILNYCKSPITDYKMAVSELYTTNTNSLNEWINGMCRFHIANSEDDLTLAFNREHWQYFPIEIITLLQLRSQQGLPIDFITHPLLKDFLPFIAQKLPVPLDETTRKLEKRILEK
ncbi:hypothetical protein [Chryseobacterium sp.]|uniref:hypothetical protein n=1 Tax=Chryseobacterium sp. TaxID=1871047 RepID=UPI0031E37E7D